MAVTTVLAHHPDVHLRQHVFTIALVRDDLFSVTGEKEDPGWTVTNYDAFYRDNPISSQLSCRAQQLFPLSSVFP